MQKVFNTESEKAIKQYLEIIASELNVKEVEIPGYQLKTTNLFNSKGILCKNGNVE